MEFPFVLIIIFAVEWAIIHFFVLKRYIHCKPRSASSKHFTKTLPKAALGNRMTQGRAAESYVAREPSFLKRAEDGSEPWEIDRKKIKLRKKIGEGSFGEVWYGFWLGSPVAVKTIISSLETNHEFIESFVDEIRLMSTLHHPNVVMFLGACMEPRKLCLVLEYCDNGNLHRLLRDQKIQFNFQTMLKFALDIARGIHYLHSKEHIIQRDLKSRNVLVDKNMNMKIADFGLSRLVDQAGQAQNMTACGTPAWTAPEIVRREAYDEKVDVYSFGIVLWELLVRDEPFRGEKGVQIAYAACEQGRRPHIPNYCPDDYRQLMEDCWADDASQRPDLTTVMNRLFSMKKKEDPVIHRRNSTDTTSTAHQSTKLVPLEGVTIENIDS
eukprot:TRINITY_DN491_c0_g1_i1.p1 TRINITY_DN491_c0_g1~~TRINITY_DN491_c0_g1_i1.p1  ORF type:complete len:382 (-),score=93.17 TRINITY_DN491_c0_g1_i1:462-1607(-)